MVINRLYVGAEDLWSWVGEALGKVDQDVLEALDIWGLDDDEPRRDDLLLTFVPAGGHPSPLAMVWGVPPPWIPGDPPLYTLPSETALSEPPWTEWLAIGRCVVPVSAYSTREQRGAWVRLRDGESAALAALYGPYAPLPGEYRCALLTIPAGEDLSPRHQRQPVIVPAQHVRRWLDPSVKEPEALQELLQPLPAGSLEIEELMRVVRVPDRGTQGA